MSVSRRFETGTDRNTDREPQCQLPRCNADDDANRDSDRDAPSERSLIGVVSPGSVVGSSSHSTMGRRERRALPRVSVRGPAGRNRSVSSAYRWSPNET
ncbi:hypothetical protein C486_08530 [Natrinema gari JCM 14663]|uniref:Uncharacterized protein n=1 Tax=Natrinema gari JCM 14663 TaxID=1230459 RepID=L9Z1Q2_9EURY|nr:hypothetical protein C486_08530 [Natrinema gari JCM 14663]